MALQGSIALFDKTLQQLIRGDKEAGVIDPPNSATVEALDAVSMQWAAYRRVLEKALRDEPVTRGDLDNTAALANSVLALSHKTVGLYVAN